MRWVTVMSNAMCHVLSCYVIIMLCYVTMWCDVISYNILILCCLSMLIVYCYIVVMVYTFMYHVLGLIWCLHSSMAPPHPHCDWYGFCKWSTCTCHHTKRCISITRTLWCTLYKSVSTTRGNMQLHIHQTCCINLWWCICSVSRMVSW